jgi:hypothetical protein
MPHGPEASAAPTAPAAVPQQAHPHVLSQEMDAPAQQAQQAQQHCSDVPGVNRGSPLTRRRSGAGVGVFGGMTFFVSGFTQDPSERRALIDLLRKNGGDVAEHLPPPPSPPSQQQQQQQRRRRQQQQQQAQPAGPVMSVLICDIKCRTPKYLYAAAKGLPVLLPSWVHACVGAGRRVPMEVRASGCREGNRPACHFNSKRVPPSKAAPCSGGQLG